MSRPESRRVRVGDMIEFSGVMRTLTRLSPYRGPLYPKTLPDAMLADWSPGPTKGITIEDPNSFCSGCSTYIPDCRCEDA